MARTLQITVVLALVAACGDDTKGGLDTQASTRTTYADGMIGSLDLSIKPDASAQAINPGKTPTTISDGWTVRYSKFLIVFGEFSADAGGLSIPEHLVVDLVKNLDGLRVNSIAEVPSGTYSHFSFKLPAADATAIPAGPDRDLMIAGGYSVYVEGAITKKGGQSCPPGDTVNCVPAGEVKFKWGFAGGTLYDDCPDFNIFADDRTEISVVVPGDRWFDTTFLHDDGSALRAQWIADADQDHNGETTLKELAALDAAKAFRAQLGYDLSDAPIKIVTGLDWATAHVRTLARTRSGECLSAAL